MYGPHSASQYTFGRQYNLNMLADQNLRDLRAGQALTDEGQHLGLAAGERPGHFGLLGMRERAAELGARFSVESDVAMGTRITVTVPGGVVFENYWRWPWQRKRRNRYRSSCRRPGGPSRPWATAQSNRETSACTYTVTTIFPTC